MHKTLLIQKNKGLLVPEGFLKLATERFKSGLGFAVLTEVEKRKVLLTGSALGSFPVEKMHEMQKAYEADQIVFCLHDGDKLTEDQLQPYCVKQSEEKAGEEPDDLMVVMLDGEFPSYDKGDNPDFFNVTSTALGPFLGKMFRQCNGDFKLINEELNDPITEQVINGFSANRATVTVLTADGNIKTFSKGELRKAFPWGIVSQHLGWSEESGTGTKETTKTSSAAAQAKRRMFGGAPVASTEPITPSKKDEPIAPNNAPPAPKPDTALPEGTADKKMRDDTYLWFKPVDSMRDHGKVKSCYRTYSINTQCPPDWEKRPWVRSKFTKEEFAKSEYDKHRLVIQVYGEEQKPVEKTKPKEADPAQKPGTEALPMLNPEQTKRLHEFWAQDKYKTLRAKGKQFDASAIQAKEKDLPSFEQVSGIDFETTFHMDYGMMVELGKTAGIEALAMLAFRSNRLYMEALATDPKSKTGGEQVTHPAGASDAAASGGKSSDVKTKKRMFG
jgi:hypothetical protein